MSYDICLKDPKTGEAAVLDETHFMRGGTYAVGGCGTAELNVTYNYSKFFYDVLGEKGIRTIYGMTGADSIPVLQEAISRFSLDDVTDNCWEPTQGNAKKALLCLLALANMRPDCVWDGD